MIQSLVKLHVQRGEQKKTRSTYFMYTLFQTTPFTTGGDFRTLLVACCIFNLQPFERSVVHDFDHKM